MIRDRRMQLLIAKNQEPITPFIDSSLYTDWGIHHFGDGWQWLF